MILISIIRKEMLFKLHTHMVYNVNPFLKFYLQVSTKAIQYMTHDLFYIYQKLNEMNLQTSEFKVK